MMTNKIRLTREQAEALADALLATAPRARDSAMARAGRAWRECAVGGSLGTWHAAPVTYIPLGHLNTFARFGR